MTHQIDISKARVYVGTYRKKNEGSVAGGWLNLADYSDDEDFYTACADLHQDEDDPEFLFQQYENIPDNLINEWGISYKLFDIIMAFEDLGESKKAPFVIWCTARARNLEDENIEQLIACFEDDYIGEYATEEDYARELVDNREDLSDFAREYFDYESYAYDLFCGNHWSQDGYVFCIS